ncbi:hypothetical protein E2562_038469 [Oryza meyeriana var. granulata]|uniref:Uncharacterized protein n=1 Tax=Oryza meyeriana var. granulata TaxID=110450 RepID=A0A6G1E7K5_9ORYZ|nr:hypothetical protein E2562_038469 [Oryza meyeriana var. granulata]
MDHSMAVVMGEGLIGGLVEKMLMYLWLTCEGWQQVLWVSTFGGCVQKLGVGNMDPGRGSLFGKLVPTALTARLACQR